MVSHNYNINDAEQVLNHALKLDNKSEIAMFNLGVFEFR